MVHHMRNALNLFLNTTTPTRCASVAIVRVLRIPGTLACPTSTR
jgi:hypothetical protein